MKTTTTTLFTLALATVTIGVPLATNPYAPVTGQCEANAESAVTTVNTTDLLDQESEWLVGRKNVTDTAWEAYITNLGLVDLDTAAVAGGAPRIALAASGGGLRAMLSGAGVFTAFDAQVPDSIETKTGGILQMSTYMGGLSGGSWLVSSLLANEMPPVNEWAKTYININTTVFYPGTNDIEAVANYKRFFTQINAKEAAGFDTNLVDLWAKGMAYQILNKIPSYGNDMLLSDFQTEGPFSSFEAPFPILVAASFRPGNSAFDYGDVFDWNPYHAGSYSPNISAFIELPIVGTSYNNEELASNDGCVTRFDNLQYTFATSSAAFALPDLSRTKTAVINQVLPDILNLTVTPEGAENFTVTRMPSFITDMEGPKPYFSELPDFYLGDGGLASSGNLPLFSLLVPARGVDVAFALDNSNDNGGYPNGNALLYSQWYSQKAGIPFPEIPTEAEFASDTSLVKQVSFFGCDEPEVPTIVYVPNHEVVYPTNTSTFQFNYTETEIDGFLANGPAMMSADPGFEDLPTCIGCLLTSFAGHTSIQCDGCMTKYCWRGAQA